jgi:drug/metabolite transporter (DMT)-like permease
MVIYLRFVMAGQKRKARLRPNVPAIHVSVCIGSKTWMPGTRPGMTENVNSSRSAKTPEADWQGTADWPRMVPNEQPAALEKANKTDLMTAAILFAFASATFLGAGVVLAQLGLRTVEPLSGAAISVPSFTLLFLLLSPLILQGEPFVWAGLPIFAAIGLFFPASLTLLTFASNRALGPVITSTLGNLAPLFAVTVAVLLLHEPLRGLQLIGLIVAVAGAVIITVTRSRDLGHWRSWALLLPLGGAVVRGVVPPIAKLGLEIWPSPLWACLIGYIMSSLVVLAVQRVRKGSFAVAAPRSGRFWFALTGISNGLSALTLFAAVRNGPITLVAPLVAIYPLVTVLLSAMMLKHVAITSRIIVGTLLTVAGVALVLAG